MNIPSYGFEELKWGEILKYQANTYPEDSAVVDLEQSIRYTYAEFNKRVNRCANMLRSFGVHKGDKICIFMNDRVEYLELFFGGSKIGAITIPCNYRFTEGEVIRQMQHSGCDIFVYSTDAKKVAENVIAKLPSTTKAIIEVGEESGSKCLSYEGSIRNHTGDEPAIEETLYGSDTVLIIYTSGTTGIPKGVIQTHRSLLGWTFNSFYESTATREDRILNPYPMFHFGGLIMSAQALFTGSSNIILGKFQLDKFLDVIEKENITMFAAVPTIIHAINNLPQEIKNRYDMSSVRTFLTSSAPLYQETYMSFTQQWPHIKIISMYTATEFYFTCLRDRDQSRKVRCVGKAAFGNEIKIFDESGTEVKKGNIGIVYGKGISLFAGYYKNEGANQKAFLNDWFTCEDVGYFDEEGYLYLVDRAKDMIISGGENIASVEVENILLQNPSIFECAVVGVHDEEWGERVHAVVSLKEGETATPEEIMEWCKGKIAGYKRPRTVSIINELPKNPTGKILKRELRDRYNKSDK